MSTRKLTAPVVTALVVLGLYGQAASAAEEVVAYGAAAAALAKESQELFRTERRNYFRSLDDEFKATLAQDLEGITAPRLRLAIHELPSRG
ncbi:hypothetical protein [Candidatus Rariloculus sp.]|uniref:hypothetical protein n=1 Tax=Candidatus Rariloculus sp. TaxID=3101265 RepID=UPI003D11BB87